MYEYPNHLAKKIEEALAASDDVGLPMPPSESVLNQLLEVAYHASLHREESRDLQFRLVLCSPEQLETVHDELDRVRFAPLRFASDRPFTHQELVRLAPATNLSTSAMAVRETDQGLSIWGLLTPRQKNAPVPHEGVLPPVPSAFNVTVLAPGVLSLSVGAETLLRLTRGTVTAVSNSIFDLGPIRDFFAPSIEAFKREFVRQSEVPTEHVAQGVWLDAIEDHYFSIFDKIAKRVEALGHGGTILIVPEAFTGSDFRLTSRVKIKYPLEDFALAPMLTARQVSVYNVSRGGIRKLDKAVKHSFEDVLASHKLHEETVQTADILRRIVRVLANLTQVDGAVILTRDLRVLGFGAEVVVGLPSPESVAVAQRSDGETTSDLSTESFGTRHRSAFRFCANLEDSVAVIFSQDGGTKFAKQVGSRVTLWTNLETQGIAAFRSKFWDHATPEVSRLRKIFR